MKFLLDFITYLIIVSGLTNLIRMTVLLIGADLYSVKKHFQRKNYQFTSYPKISVVIPAYNESRSIIKTLNSLTTCNYPQKYLEIIVVDDGSSDTTYEKVKRYIQETDSKNIQAVHQENSGKAHALNNGMRNYAKGELVMCLDADSYLEKDALTNAIFYFQDKSLMVLGANVQITPAKGMLNLIQQVEYLVSYQLKKAQAQFNIEYIIGGIGSLFRRSYLEKIDFYDTNTVTEDIDVTMKIIRNGNKRVKVSYAEDVIAYTQSVRTIRDLIRQRSRWKWGRYQTFLKNRHMFFSSNKAFSKGLSWIYLPYALFSDLALLFEPLIVGYLLIIILYFHDSFTFFSAFAVLTFYTSMNILSENTLPIRKKLFYLFIAPLTYFLFYVISLVEYIALIKSLIKLHTLPASLQQKTNRWTPVSRFNLTN